jgi:hypothetical protein
MYEQLSLLPLLPSVRVERRRFRTYLIKASETLFLI